MPFGLTNGQLNTLFKAGESLLLLIAGLYELHTGDTTFGIVLAGSGAAGLGFTGTLPSTSASTSTIAKP